ncbi:cryptochrome/photolyase family protein [Neptunomonas phycophila]|uniref:cryptochrome/photolyase family protein n=1 Tax=Neptunomonas phycophila TaxID=1572645 RepID=UPI0030F819A5
MADPLSPITGNIRTLHIVLGDQLNEDSFLWDGFDPSQDAALMAEVIEESLPSTTQQDNGLAISSKQRTLLFFSAMRHFAQQMTRNNIPLIYWDIPHKIVSLSDALQQTYEHCSPTNIKAVLPGDYRVYNALNSWAKRESRSIEWLEDTHFLAQKGEFKQWMSKRKKPIMEYWYRHLRQRKHLLMDNKKPEGGQWNFDADNRKSFGKAGPTNLPTPPTFSPDPITLQAQKDIDKHLSELPGTLEDFNWPVTRSQALEALDSFINTRLASFGDHQDAMWTNEQTLFHSLLSSSLNLKLINPQEVVEATLVHYQAGHAPINAVEGFIRQIVGWREYVRGLYWYHRADWLTWNALEANQPLPDFYWTGKTHMHCMNQSITQVLQTGYGHHIQRLMVTGLFSLLYGVNPKAIHQWYLGFFVDAIAWVEVPNTLGMSQYADGGIVGSKPYIASGNYINKMSNYCKHCRYNPKKSSGDDACPFTTLYWNFVDKHQERLSKNPRLAMQVKHWSNKAPNEQQAIKEQTLWLVNHIQDI